MLSYISTLLIPDLNPIELVWGLMKTKVEKRKPSTIEELKEAITSAWDELPIKDIQEFINHLVNYLPLLVEYEGKYPKKTA